LAKNGPKLLEYRALNLGWLGLTAGKPQGPSLGNWGVTFVSAASHPDSGRHSPGSWGVAFVSAASHPDTGDPGMVELSEQTGNLRSLVGSSALASDLEKSLGRLGLML